MDRPKHIYTTFARFKQGEGELTPLFHYEREYLYDFLMRMTGQVSRSIETVEETFLSLESIGESVDTLEECLSVIYKTARNFCADLWTTDTTKLVHNGYDASASEHLILFEESLKKLPSVQKECLLLKFRQGFSDEDILQITGYSGSDLQIYLQQGLDALAIDKQEARTVFPQLLQFPMPSLTAEHTRDLSLIMKGVKRSGGMSSRKKRHVALIVILGVIFLVFAVFWFYSS